MVNDSSAKPLNMLMIMENSSAPIYTAPSSSFLVFISVLKNTVDAMIATIIIWTVLNT